jgi:hypothetical protein
MKPIELWRPEVIDVPMTYPDGIERGIAREIVHVDVDRRLAPIPTLILEQPHQLLLLRIDADNRLPSLGERVSQFIDVRELLVPIGRRPPRQPLSIESKSILRPTKHLPSLGVAYPEGSSGCMAWSLYSAAATHVRGAA